MLWHWEMNTKIVYVLVSRENDIYTEQAYVSMFSVKYHMPDAHITLIIDSITKESLSKRRVDILQYVDELITVPITGKYTPMQISRVLKTTVRFHVLGDFLFLDSDIIVTDTLYEIDSFQFNIGAVLDLHVDLFQNYLLKDVVIHRLHKYFGYNKDVNQYFNSGVLYVKECEEANQFYNLWHEKWKEGCSKGLNVDQPALVIANDLMSSLIAELDGIYNCQIRYTIRYLYDAKIIHYFTARIEDFSPLFTLNFYMTIKNKGNISFEDTQLIINCKRSFSVMSMVNTGIAAEISDVSNSRFINSAVFIRKKSKTAYLLLVLFVRAYKKLIQILFR